MNRQLKAKREADVQYISAYTVETRNSVGWTLLAIEECRGWIVMGYQSMDAFLRAEFKGMIGVKKCRFLIHCARMARLMDANARDHIPA